MFSRLFAALSGRKADPGQSEGIDRNPPQEEAAAAQRKTYQIRVEDMGGQFPCREDEFILEAMKRAGCGPIHYGCFGGGCGVCKMRVVSGDYQAEKKMSRAHVSEEEQKDGVVLICCVKPRGDLTVARV